MTPLSELYNEEAAELYDNLQLAGNSLTSKTNEQIINILKEIGAHKVLDMSCGTGAQCIDLSLAGFEVVATDINNNMLEKAQNKANIHGVKIKFELADMKTVSMGKFQGIISIFNAIGHLSKDDFKLALKNAIENLDFGGVLIFDTFNEEIMSTIPPIEFMDVNLNINDQELKRYTKIVFNKKEGNCLFSHKILSKNTQSQKREIKEDFLLSFYTDKELKKLLKDCGFSDIKIVHQSMLDLPNIKDSMNMVIATK